MEIKNILPIFVSAKEKKPSMKKKTYLYYATEENCFETEKFETTAPEAEAKGFLQDDYVQADTADHNVYEMMCEFRRNGYGSLRLVNGQGYEIIIGVAEQGKCRHILNEIRAARREAIAMCY